MPEIIGQPLLPRDLREGDCITIPMRLSFRERLSLWLRNPLRGFPPKIIRGQIPIGSRNPVSFSRSTGLDLH